MGIHNTPTIYNVAKFDANNFTYQKIHIDGNTQFVTEKNGEFGFVEILICNELPLAYINAWLPLKSNVNQLYNFYEIVPASDSPFNTAEMGQFGPPLCIDDTQTKSGYIHVGSDGTIYVAVREMSLANKTVSSGFVVMRAHKG